MTIVFCGPPHSGKSVLIANLKKRLPDDSQRVLRACPDGEGDWSNEEGNFNIDVRNKGTFTPEFVKRFCRAIDNNKSSKIVIVDVGGIRTDENKEIFSHCDNYVVLCNTLQENKEELIKWKQFADSIIKKGTNNEHLNCLALLDSELEGAEELYINEDNLAPLKGKVTGLKRKTLLKSSPLIDKLAARIIKESGYTIENSRQLELNNLSGLALAYSVGCQKTEMIEDIEVPKAFWSYDSIVKVYKVLSELVAKDQNKTKEVNIDAVRPAFILCACVKALRDAGIETIKTMDSENNAFVPIRKLEQRDGISAADGLIYNVIEGKKSVFLDLDIEKQNYTLEEYANCVLPKINIDKPLYISGRIPNWLMASIATSYESPKISVLQPPKGFVCTCSKDKKELGVLQENIPEINLDKYFEDKKKAIKNGGNFIYQNDDYLVNEKDYER